MVLTQEVRNRLLLTVATAAAAAIPVSIALSQTLLGVGLVLLLVFRQKLSFPRIWIPLACLFLWTALADVVSPDPWAGRAQIKKFFVFLFIPLLFSIFREQFPKTFYLIALWTVAGTASALLALVQFARTAHESYIAYVGRRITGFESHWMTFGGLELSILLLLLAHAFFASRRFPFWAYSGAALIAAAILLGGTRSIWLASLPSLIYLIAVWRPKMLLLLPIVALVAFVTAPANVRERILSVTHPQADIDSNRHRSVTFRTGMEMVKAHPWLGLGPEEIGRNFNAYVPKYVPRPLPVGYYGHLHNIYLQYAAERGIPGLVGVLWFIGVALWDCLRGAFRNDQPQRSDEKFILHGTVAIVIAILTGGCFEYNLGDSEVLMFFVSVIALSYSALYWRHKNAGPERVPLAPAEARI